MYIVRVLSLSFVSIPQRRTKCSCVQAWRFKRLLLHIASLTISLKCETGALYS